jgi:hypothetical protein
MTTTTETAPAETGAVSAIADHNDLMPVTPAVEAALAAAADDLAATTKAREKAVQACRRAVQKANAAGMTEVELAVLMGVNRLTIRRWLGKN